jgi:hypothetical protein
MASKHNHSARKKLTPEHQAQVALEAEFDNWWRTEGAYIDPDFSEVDWYDKRRELCFYAYRAAKEAAK